MFDFPDAAGRAPDKQFCFSPEGADSPYETYFPIACTTVPCLQPRSQWSNSSHFFLALFSTYAFFWHDQHS